MRPKASFLVLGAVWIGVLAVSTVPGVARAEGLPPGQLTLDRAVAYALSHHPRVQAQAASAQGSQAQVSVARAGYLPELGVSVQLNVGSGNVLRGPLFPMMNIPAVSGPPTGRSLSDGSLGSVVGLGASWNALGLPAQIAQVDAALANLSQAQAALDVQRLEVAYAAADQFLDVLAQKKTVQAARATVERARVLSTIVRTLVKQDLRPGVDGARAEAELALALTQLIRAEQAQSVSRAFLARALGAAGQALEVADEGLPLPVPAPAAATNQHPLLAQAAASVRVAEFQKRVAELAYLPRLDLVGALWARGSGLNSLMLPPSEAAGLAPDTPNFAAGLILTWPALQIFGTTARVQAARAQVQVARAQRSEVEQVVLTQLETARQIVDAARRISANTPIALQAARAAEAQALARYRAGLANVVDVAEAQRLLAQAELDDGVAQLSVRRAELLLSRALGDLSPFFASAHAQGEGG